MSNTRENKKSKKINTAVVGSKPTDVPSTTTTTALLSFSSPLAGKIVTDNSPVVATAFQNENLIAADFLKNMYEVMRSGFEIINRDLTILKEDVSERKKRKENPNFFIKDNIGNNKGLISTFDQYSIYISKHLEPKLNLLCTNKFILINECKQLVEELNKQSIENKDCSSVVKLKEIIQGKSKYYFIKI